MTRLLEPSINEQVPPAAIEAVLEHVARYRLTVFAALHRLPIFRDRHGNQHVSHPT